MSYNKSDGKNKFPTKERKENNEFLSALLRNMILNFVFFLFDTLIIILITNTSYWIIFLFIKIFFRYAYETIGKSIEFFIFFFHSHYCNLMKSTYSSDFFHFIRIPHVHLLNENYFQFKLKGQFMSCVLPIKYDMQTTCMNSKSW